MSKKIKVSAIILARMESSRLPGKSLKLLGGITVLERVIKLVQRANGIDDIVVATTTSNADDSIENICMKLNVKCFRGSKDDVLGRFVEAISGSDSEYIFRINADNPFIAPSYLEKLIIEAEKKGYDYISFCLSDGRPVMLSSVGFFAEIISRSCLLVANQLINDPFEREHVTLGIYKRPETFGVKFIELPSLFEDINLRLTLDTSKDFHTISQIVNALGEDSLETEPEDIVELIAQHKEWQDSMLEENELNPKTANSK